MVRLLIDLIALTLPMIHIDFAPLIIDNSQPIGNDDTEVSIDSAGLKRSLYRDQSPKEKYFDQLVTDGKSNSRSALDHVNDKQDMIKQLQE